MMHARGLATGDRRTRDKAANAARAAAAVEGAHNVILDLLPSMRSDP